MSNICLKKGRETTGVEMGIIVYQGTLSQSLNVSGVCGPNRDRLHGQKISAYIQPDYGT
ncbi:MAG: hypothetical protein WCT01_00935 [Candidatus Shapirobacteria bacterium]